jgi:Flp pilus assembly protein TadG
MQASEQACSKLNSGQPVDRISAKERGQSLVEMAFVVPILALFLVVIVDASRAFDALIVLTNAAREGARFASLEPTPDDGRVELLIINDVLDSGTNITQMTDFSADNITIEWGTTATTVTLTYEFDLWFGGIVGLSNLPLTRESVMPKYLPAES